MAPETELYSYKDIIIDVRFRNEEPQFKHTELGMPANLGGLGKNKRKPKHRGDRRFYNCILYNRCLNHEKSISDYQQPNDSYIYCIMFLVAGFMVRKMTIKYDY